MVKLFLLSAQVDIGILRCLLSVAGEHAELSEGVSSWLKSAEFNPEPPVVMPYNSGPVRSSKKLQNLLRSGRRPAENEVPAWKILQAEEF